MTLQKESAFFLNQSVLVKLWMVKRHLGMFDFKRFTAKRYLTLHNEQRLNLGEMVQRRWGVVWSVVLMFVDIVRRGERTTHFPSSHPPPWWRGDSWEHGESRSERRGSNRLRKHSDYNDNDTCAERLADFCRTGKHEIHKLLHMNIYHVKIHFANFPELGNYISSSPSWISCFYNQSRSNSNIC